jgi:hypothetical protein
MTDLWNLGFGTISARTLVQGCGGPILYTILLTNIPQLFLSALYIIYNGLWTSVLSEDEWQRYSYQRRPLRVTAPTGQQRSTYFLSLPYRYSISLMIVCGFLHWLVSQSVYLALVIVLDEHDVPIPADQITTCGLSGIAFMIGILVWAVILIAAVVIGFRRFTVRMPLARGSSIVISAACHPHELDEKASLLPVKWGAMDEGEPGHCTLTSYFVYEPVPGRLYA